MAEVPIIPSAPEKELFGHPPSSADPLELPSVSNEYSKEEKVLESPKEKTVEVAEERKAQEEAKDKASEHPVPVKSFKEESYRVGDLKESERRALEEFKLKVEEALKARSFEKPPTPGATREVETEQKVEGGEDGEAKVVETKMKPQETETSVPSCQVRSSVPAEEEPISEIPSDKFAKREAAAYDEPVKQEEAARSPPPPSVTMTITEGTGLGGPTEVPAETEGQEVMVEKIAREVSIEEKAAAPMEDYSLWGVPLLHTEGDERTDVILLKFLRARDYKVNDAFDMLRSAVIWRKEFFTDMVVEEDLGSEFDTVAYGHGCDKEGHPVCYNDYGLFYNKEIYNKTFGDENEANKFLRWRIEVIEKSIQKLNFNPGGVHSLVQVTDLKHSPGFLKWIHITSKALTLLQDNYPELVAKQIFINVPWYFGALYSIYGRLITQRQKSKVVVARPGKVAEALFKYISPEHVPLKYGGLSRPNDTEFEGVRVSVKEVTVKAGEKQTIELTVEPGVAVVWDLVVVGCEVIYSEEFVPSAEGGYTVIIKKSKRLGAREEPIRNSFKVTEPGKILLIIDNCASRRKRTVFYRHLTKKPIPE